MGTTAGPLRIRIERPAPSRNKTTVADLISGLKTPRSAGGKLPSHSPSRSGLRTKESIHKAQTDVKRSSSINGDGKRKSFLTTLDQMGVKPEPNKVSYEGTTVGFLLDAESKPHMQTKLSKLAARKSTMFRTEDFEKVQHDRASTHDRKNPGLSPSPTTPSDERTVTTDDNSAHLSTEADFGRLTPKMFKSSIKSSLRFNPDDDVFQIVPVGEAGTKAEAGVTSRTRAHYDEDPFKPAGPPHPEERWFTYATKDYSLPDPSDIPKTNQLHSRLPPITPSCVARDPHLPTNHRLTDVKHSLYNPDIKTFRVLADDDRFGGICGENLRHTTQATAEDFALAEAGIYKPPTRPLATPPPMCPSMCRRMNKDSEFERANDVWRKFLDAPTCIPTERPEAEKFLFKDAADRLKYFRFENQMVKFGKRPNEAAKFMLKSEPSLENYQQRPLPQDVLRRYR